MPMHPNLKLGYSHVSRDGYTTNIYLVIVYNDPRYSGDPIYFETKEDRQKFIDDYYPPEPTPSPPSPPAPSEPSNNGEPTPPAVTASYGLLFLVCFLVGLAYFLWR